MKLHVMIPGSRFTADLPDLTCKTHYAVFVNTLLDAIAEGKVDDEPAEADDEQPEPFNAEPELPERCDERPETDNAVCVAPEPEETNAVTAKGVLYLGCPYCGNTWFTFAKEEQGLFYCKACSQQFSLTEPLIPAWAKCDACGTTSRAFTNLAGTIFDISCRNCKAPVTVEYIKKKNCYQTIPRG